MRRRSKASVLSEVQTSSTLFRMPRSTRPPPPEQDSISSFGCLARRRSMISYTLLTYFTQIFFSLRGPASGQPGSEKLRFISHFRNAILFADKLVEPREGVLLHIVTRHIQDELIARLGARPT